MPTRRRRNEWPFSGSNPLKGLDSNTQYERVQWGHQPDKIVIVNVPMRRKQDLIMMGRFRLMVVRQKDGSEITISATKPYPFLAFGKSDNRLWIAGESIAEMAKALKEALGTGNIGDIVQTDYESMKGEKKSFYYYHEHHAPYAKLRIHSNGYPEYVGGGYSVRPEGIVD